MLFTLFIFTLLANGIQSVHEIICENDNLNIECPKATVIRVEYANYGRRSSTICSQNGLNQNLNCSTINATQIMQQRCNGEHNCTVIASNKIFSDPCVGTYKYLELNYTCEPIIGQCDQPNEEYHCVDRCFREFCNSPPPPRLCYITPLCIGRCVCREGYLRDPKTERCISKKYCPLPGSECETHEVFSECGAACQKTCTRRNPVCSRICVPGYVCASNYIRDPDTKRCIRPQQCPVKT